VTSMRRRGVTLIELLVVIGIILAITAAVIPVMGPVMGGRRLREGTRGVNTFINSARNRAMVTGRPVGVSFERLEAEPQASMLLHMVQVPPPWSGSDTRTVMRINDFGQIIGIGHYEVGAFGAQWLPDNYWLTLVRPGDLVELNNRKERFRLWSGEPYLDVPPTPPPSNPPDPPLPPNGQWDNGEPFADSNDNGGYDPASANQTTQINSEDPTKTVYFQLPSPIPTEPLPNLASSYEVSNNINWTLGYDSARMSHLRPALRRGDYQFKIIRQPVKSASISYQLPVGTVVDLGVSGVDQGSYFAPLDNNDLSPVILLFAPNGSIDRVWCHQGMTAGGPLNATIWSSSRPTSSVQFLVGRREAVGLTVPPGEGPDVIPNWFDLENLWIGVKSQTGAVATNPNAAVFDGDVQVNSPPPLEVDARLLIPDARAFARQGQSMGGN